MPNGTHGSIAATLLATLVSLTPAGASDTGLVEQINQYRASPDHCDGADQVESAPPLTADERLSSLRIASGNKLQAALRDAGYFARETRLISVTGPANSSQALQLMKQHYCAALLDPQFSHAGVSRSNGGWQLILARPLLSNTLDDWKGAGQEVLQHVNNARAEPRQCGSESFDAAPALSWNEQLAEAARAHSHDMAERDYFGHSSPDGERIADRVDREGYQWRRIGENIGAGVGSAEDAVAGWLDSPPHCRNLMDPDYTQMGAAYAISPDSKAGIYWTQVFGRPR